jgi:hypothetical protein
MAMGMEHEVALFCLGSSQYLGVEQALEFQHATDEQGKYLH